MSRCRSFLLVLVCGGSVLASAQQPCTIGARGYYGFLWPHSKSMWGLVQGHAPAVEVFAERQVLGDRQWHHDYLMPHYGVGVLYTNMANPGTIGAAFRIAPYLRLPFVRGERSSFGMRLGWGIGYVTKPFQRIDNPKQIAIGSRVNTAIQIMLDHRMAIGPWAVSTGIGIDHWSNGAYQLPNLGLNYLALNLAIARNTTTVEPVPVMIDTTRIPVPRREWMAVGAFGVSEAVRAGTGKHSVFSLMAQVQWRLGRKSALAAGLDVFNKGSLATAEPELKDKGRMELTQLGVHGGYALLLGKGELFLQMGAYVLTPVPDQSAVFHRLGGRLRVGKHLLLNVALKSHFAVADHWEFGLGYRWE